LNEHLRTVTAANPGSTIDFVAQSFVKAGILTRFQAKQMKLGRYKKFVLSGKYRILELIGTGGMGAVYLCEHGFMKRLVAIKVLPAEKLTDPSNLERFYREARVIAAMDHPNIVRAYNIEQSENLHYLVMEYVDGTSLQELVARFGPLSPPRVANYAYQAAVGLRHATELGLVHRDIKPGNLLLERTGIIKILDMGLARFFLNDENNEKLTERFDEKCILGTADYLAPEQAMTSKVDIRADLYGLGGTMYFMLTGKSPVPDGNVTQKLLFQQKHDPPPVTNYRKDVPVELLKVVTKLMQKKADLRYQSPDELLDALARMTEQSPIVPPDYEMPDLCPAVAGLTGHMMDKQRKATATAVMANFSDRMSRPSAPGSGAALIAAGPRSPAGHVPSLSDLCLLNPEVTEASTTQTKGFASTMTPVVSPGPVARQAAPVRPPDRREIPTDGDIPAPDVQEPTSDFSTTSLTKRDFGRIGLIAAIAIAGMVVLGGVLYVAFGR
jgi:serine/threonine protein kinase